MQVLPRFEGFPMKKLESLRAAATLYLKLKGILTNLQNWKVVPPLEQLLYKVESYFDKVNIFHLWQTIHMPFPPYLDDNFVDMITQWPTDQR